MNNFSYFVFPLFQTQMAIDAVFYEHNKKMFGSNAEDVSLKSYKRFIEQNEIRRDILVKKQENKTVCFVGGNNYPFFSEAFVYVNPSIFKKDPNAADYLVKKGLLVIKKNISAIEPLVKIVSSVAVIILLEPYLTFVTALLLSISVSLIAREIFRYVVNIELNRSLVAQCTDDELCGALRFYTFVDSKKPNLFNRLDAQFQPILNIGQNPSDFVKSEIEKRNIYLFSKDASYGTELEQLLDEEYRNCRHVFWRHSIKDLVRKASASITVEGLVT